MFQLVERLQHQLSLIREQGINPSKQFTGKAAWLSVSCCSWIWLGKMGAKAVKDDTDFYPTAQWVQEMWFQSAQATNPSSSPRVSPRIGEIIAGLKFSY